MVAIYSLVKTTVLLKGKQGDKVMKSRCRVALVEENPLIRDGLRILLSREKDFEVVGTAGNGEEALHLVQKAKPDLVISDLAMPQMDVTDMIMTIKKQNPGIKIAVLTVHHQQEKVTAALKAGADGYILKEASYSDGLLDLRSMMNEKTL